jgi:PPK2 family polyphosphate:nucleotide phosphotransferase
VDVRSAYQVGPSFDLATFAADAVLAGPRDKEAAAKEIAALEDEASTLHEQLYAESKAGGRRAVLVVLQGMDTSGKGGATKVLDRLLDPLGFSIVGFGKPTDEEAARGYLWRHEQAVPEPGRIRVWDRSHYETVLIERVRSLVPEDVWQARYGEIVEFERNLVDSGVTVLKVMLHISKDEQRERLLARLDDETKHWKYRPGDVDERALWDDYQAAYQDALVRCSSEHAPWYCVPADRKWHRDWVLAHLVVETLRALRPQYPAADFDVAAERGRVEAS